MYAAHDTVLQRPCAVKFLRPAVTAAHTQLLRAEAQALAAVSHPNVLSVFDVGMHAERVYMATERVDAGTLRDVLTSTGPDTTATLRLFVQAGRGLEAAHAAGIIHRDFKPDNVLVGRDGRVRVADFGLAIGARARRFPSPPSQGVAGTPRYMAPECWSTGGASIRSDVFAFCASLRDALRVPPPRWLRRALKRGLSPEPHRRWGSMGPLLRAIDRELGPRLGRRRPRVAVGVGLGVVALALGSAGAWPRGDCRPTSSPIAPQDRSTLAAAFERVDASFAAQSASEVDTALARFSSAWLEARQTACSNEAAPNPARLRCLDHARLRAKAIVVALGREQNPALRGVQAVSELPRPERCLAAPNSTLPQLRGDDDERFPHPAVRELIHQSAAARSVGDLSRAAELGRRALSASARSELAATRAEAHLEFGTALEAQGDYAGAKAALSSALWIAVEHQADDTAARAATTLLFIAVRRDFDLREAERWSRHAAAAMQRAGRPLDVESKFLSNLATLQMLRGHPVEARRLSTRAVALQRELAGENTPAYATAAHNHAATLFQLGDPASALTVCRRVVRIRERLLGTGHPQTISSYTMLGAAMHEVGRPLEARASLRKALTVAESALGDQHPETILARNNLAYALLEAGHAQAAFTQASRALAASSLGHGPSHVETASASTAVGWALVRLGRPEEALAHFERAVAVHHETTGYDDPRLSVAYRGRGQAFLDLGLWQAAEAQFTRATSVLLASSGTRHPGYSSALRGRGEARWRGGDASAGRHDLEQALQLARASGTDPQERAQTLFALARLSWEIEHDRDEARGFVERALQRLDEAPGLDTPLANEIEAWWLQFSPTGLPS